MKKVLSALVVFGLVAGISSADNPKPALGKEEPAKKVSPPVSLKAGDRAPALKASKWLQGRPVSEFKSGNVYVIEFWATWCGPCIASMPHTAELYGHYRDKGVTIVAFTTQDPNNTLDNAAAFVKKRGAKLPFNFAYSDDKATFDAWMTAAGRAGIPCAFVVDRGGRIAYIGHPMYLGVALPKAVADNATPQTVSAEMRKVEEEFREAAVWRDRKEMLQSLAHFEAKYPAMANIPPWIRTKLSFLPKYGKPGEAKQFAEAIIAKGIEQGDPVTLGMVSGILRSGDGKESKELLSVALKAAEAELLIAGGKDAGALLNLAETYFAIGDKTHAREYALQAIAAASEEPAALKESIEKGAKTLVDEGEQQKK
ncbi:MAG TPA: redoxin family protein [Gemmataceae bacterium]|nr:redoxin family protein [Gemmataceae bacterium]